YLLQAPTPERLTEAVQRLEEILTDEVEIPVAPMGVAVSLGPAIDVRTFPGDRKGERNGDPLARHLRAAMQERIDHLLLQGPPPEWGCPTPSKRLVLAEPGLPHESSPPRREPGAPALPR